MVSASPTLHSFLPRARCGRTQIPATEQKESSTNWPVPTRERKTESAAPPSQSRQRWTRSGTVVALRNKPQMFTSPPGSWHNPT